VQQAGGPFWHVTLSLAGDHRPTAEVRASLLRLAEQHPFLLAGRYATDRAEVHYWEEAAGVSEATSLALAMWDALIGGTSLAGWSVVGLEVLERDTYRVREDAGRTLAGGDIRPY
jgi:hypothetical protein